MKSFAQLTEKEPNSLMIVDSLNLAFRYSHQKAKNFAEDYMRTVSSLQKSYKCDKVVIGGDKGSSSYRKAIYPLYKGNRAEKYANQTPEEAEYFKEFIEEVNHILDLYIEQDKYPVLRFQGVECDDIAAYICLKRKKFGIARIMNISSDRDWLLNLSEHVSQFSYSNKKEFYFENWSEHYDHSIEDYISIKVLQGDSGDNVPGVPGIGPKKALALVQQYGSALDIAAALPIQSKYKHIQALNEFGAEAIERNYKLMDLVTFCEEAIGEENCRKIDEVLEAYLKQ